MLIALKKQKANINYEISCQGFVVSNQISVPGFAAVVAFLMEIRIFEHNNLH